MAPNSITSLYDYINAFEEIPQFAVCLKSEICLECLVNNPGRLSIKISCADGSLLERWHQHNREGFFTEAYLNKNLSQTFLSNDGEGHSKIVP